MSNQVHPLLAKRDSKDVEDETSLHGWPLLNEKIERSKSNHKSYTSTRKSGKKWRKYVQKGGIWEEALSREIGFQIIPLKINRNQRRIIGSKRSKHIGRDDTTSEGDYSPLPLHRKPITKHSESSENDAMSDYLLDDDSCIQNQRRANTNEAKFIDTDVFSDDTMGYGSDWLWRRELSNEQDAISDDSLSVGSLQLRGKTPKGKYRKYITEEYMISDDQREVYFWK
ncbi:hypothetical protein DEO72_LG6g1470 [Vigna unguiculata]|uniref:Uncharacterized protein n=1 Tax=Vigna unguiculata TaxID=3917 RepID=A0A4D6M8P2_VIGUN|nr:hypothetical protein DEO72_LG6g1470 [Vigna unguiculata]